MDNIWIPTRISSGNQLWVVYDRLINSDTVYIKSFSGFRGMPLFNIYTYTVSYRRPLLCFRKIKIDVFSNALLYINILVKKSLKPQICNAMKYRFELFGTQAPTIMPPSHISTSSFEASTYVSNRRAQLQKQVTAEKVKYTVIQTCFSNNFVQLQVEINFEICLSHRRTQGMGRDLRICGSRFRQSSKVK